jgi:WD40 repeat protein
MIQSLHLDVNCSNLLNLANDRYVKLWRITSNNSSNYEKELEYKIHMYGINQIKWNQDGNLIASAGNDCSANVMDITKVRMFIYIIIGKN